MKKAILFAGVALVAATSCNPWQGEIDQANKTSDSLRTVLAEERQISQQMSDLFEEVNANMKQIKEVELGVLNDKGQEGGTNKATIQEDFKLISERIQQSNQKINELEEKLAKSNGQLNGLRGTIGKLKKQLAESQAEMAKLKEELEAKNIKIADLENMNIAANARIDSVNAVSAQQAAAIAAQDAELNAVYYLAADKATLKNKGLLERALKKGGDIRSSDFTKVDKRDFTELDLKTKKAVILSRHPLTSYTLLPKSAEDKTLVLKIKDYNRFWSTSDYLIIQTK
ncbi:MAG: hypothetical protein U0K71_00495 [Paludibacteraceae bacterium]|jgi:chromosome segregation ATPase|nr:hypothetical protein [Paludibacteraceae bacterium]MDD5997474.1 hypothetical protein [Bacteroidales bacterium]MBR6110569.1 hypothetical protein [Paludibacteraceae bacterium]MCR5246689.1 hypothetical protein [Paludibacteraceae bacterium]MDO4523745.1 hypothetical protein [Bacteroidales bacterium]